MGAAHQAFELAFKPGHHKKPMLGLNGQTTQNRWQIGGDSTALPFPDYSAAPVHKLYVVLQPEWEAIGHRFSGIADEGHEVFGLISNVFKLADAGLDGGVIRALWCFGHFCPKINK